MGLIHWVQSIRMRINRKELKKMNNQELKEGFEELLSRYPYDIWMSVTFDEDRPQGLETARRSFRHFLSHLNTPQERFYDKHINYWAFYERNASRDGVHIHSLIDGIDQSKVPQLQRKCKDTFGQSKVDTGHSGVWHYIAEKYPYDDLLLDYDPYQRINSRYREKSKGTTIEPPPEAT